MLEQLRHQTITVLSFSMLILALTIVLSVTLRQMVRYYRIQALMLTGVVLLSAGEGGFQPALAAISLVPLLLFILIRPLLQRSTVRHDSQTLRKIVSELLIEIKEMLPGSNTMRPIDQVWLQKGHSRLRQGMSVAVSLVLVVTAFVVPAHIVRPLLSNNLPSSSLSITFTLLLLGLFTMINKHDIIAQIIGLLVMEHGMFLAAVTLTTRPDNPNSYLVLTFVLALLFYTAITLTILVWLLPALHNTSQSIDLNDEQELRG